MTLIAAGMLQVEQRHHPLLVRLVAKELGCSPEAVADFELNVCDTQPGVIGGGSAVTWSSVWLYTGACKCVLGNVWQLA